MTAEEYFIDYKVIPFEIAEDIVEDDYGNSEKQSSYNAIIPIPNCVDWLDAVSFLTDPECDINEMIVIHGKKYIQELVIGFNKDQRQAVIEFIHVMNSHEAREYE